MNFLFSVGRGALISAASAALAFAPCLAAASTETTMLRQQVSLDDNWRFHRGDVESAELVAAPAFNDRSWQQVRVPHDYVIEGTFTPPVPGEEPAKAKIRRNHGYLPLEVAWYRRHLAIPESAAGRILRLDFDGVFRDADVWFNGQHLGAHACGYTPFSFDVSTLARPGGENVIVVRVDPRAPEGWWYEGGGIYRHVRLTILSPLHIAQWGTYVVSKVSEPESNTPAQAELTIESSVENAAAGAARFRLCSEIVGPDGSSLGRAESDATAPANARQTVTQRVTVPKPQLWSLETPHLYELRTTIVRDGAPVDVTTTTFGIRTLRFDPEKGFFLNGRHVRIQGAAAHQDFAGLGLAVPDSLQPWRVAKLKAMGANGWRAAHNPPNEAVLDACDRLGMLVMDENRHFGDTFLSAPPVDSTANDLSDLATMIQRDRNHPSVIMWSMGNEGGRIQGLPQGAVVMQAMKEMVHRYDQTRPITYAMNAGWLAERGVADVADIVGVNYNPNQYDAIHARHAGKMMFGSETTNEKTARGQFVEDKANGLASAYNFSDKTWRAIADRPFLGGAYIWTGFDYRGEPNPFGWPDVSNNTGLMDMCGFPKDRYYYFESCWSERPMVHLVPSAWNPGGNEGRDIRVVAFTNARQVELFLNGRSLGVRDAPRNAFGEWTVRYEPGELLAKAVTDGKVVATDSVQTTGPAARLGLTASRTSLRADGRDAVAVEVSVFDEKGRIVPEASNLVAFRLSGGGRILGVGNGNPVDHTPIRGEARNAFHGRCLVIIEASSAAATLELAATSPGLADARLAFTVK